MPQSVFVKRSLASFGIMAHTQNYMLTLMMFRLGPSLRMGGGIPTGFLAQLSSVSSILRGVPTAISKVAISSLLTSLSACLIIAQSAGSRANGSISLAWVTEAMKWSSLGLQVLYHGCLHGTIFPKAQGIHPISEMGGTGSSEPACVPY
jgi:hypothetical protein